MIRTEEFDADDFETLTVHQRISRQRGPIVVIGLVVVGAVAAMALLPGTRHGVLWHVGMDPGMEEGTHCALVPTNSPSYGFSSVEVLLTKEADLQVDGHSLGRSKRQALQLAAGPHVLVTQQGNHVLTEKLSTPANESLRVEFTPSGVRVFREVTAMP